MAIPEDINMRRIDRNDKGDVQVGDFWWNDDGWKDRSDISSSIYIAFPPNPKLNAKFEIHWAPCSTNGANTAQDRKWNGNRDKPTIGGSWGIKHFHCWVVDGTMTMKGGGQAG